MRVAGLLVVCAALAACGNSSHPVAGTGTVTPSPGATAPGTTGSPTGATATPTTDGQSATAPPPVTTSTPPTTSAPSPSSPALCTAARLRLSVLSQQGAAGHGVIALALRNTSDRPCHTYGFPGVLFLGPGGAPLPTQPTHVTSDFVGAVPERPIVLGPDQSASFRLVVTHVAAGPGDCVNARALQVIPPDDTHTLHVTLGGGTAECRAVTVSPLQAGTAANPA